MKIEANEIREALKDDYRNLKTIEAMQNYTPYQETRDWGDFVMHFYVCFKDAEEVLNNERKYTTC